MRYKADRRRVGICLLFSLLILLLGAFSDDFGEASNNGENKDAQAVSVRINADADGGSEIDKILKELEGILPGGVICNEENMEDSVGIKAIAESLLSGVYGSVDKLCAFLALTCGVAVLFVCVEQIGALSSDTLYKGATTACATILSIPVFFALYPLIDTVKQALGGGGELFGALIPLLTSVTALGGGGVTAAAEAVGMNLALGFISGFLAEYVLPLAVMFFSLTLVRASDSEGICAAVAGAVKSFFTFVIGALSTLLLAVQALQSVIAAGADGIAMKGIKYAVSGMIPIVGGTVSGALSTLYAGVGYAKGVMGVSSILALVGIMGAPLVMLLAYRFIMKIAISVASVSGGVGANMLTSFLSALDALISVLAFSCVVYVFEIVIFMRTVSGAL